MTRTHDWFSPQQDYQLVLRDETLAVLVLVLPDGLVGREFQQARDLMNAGHLTVDQTRDAAAAMDQPSDIVCAEALDAARRDLREALADVDLDALDAAGRLVSVFSYDPERDEPRRAIDDHDLDR